MKKTVNKVNNKPKIGTFSGYEFTLRQKHYLFWKRAIDIFGSILGIIVFIPLFLIVPIIIKCSSKGPVFYLQERIGKNKKIFKIIKFRSMKQDAPEVAAENLTIEEQKAMEYRWGNFMRKTSIDEIPQLFNILAGQMSFIGPRPCMIVDSNQLTKEREQLIPSAYDVKPGMSGYAQIAMRRGHDPQEKAYLDHEYVKIFCFKIDAKIFFQTIFSVFGSNRGK